MNHETAVWITGVGAVTPVGNAYRDIADNLLAGRSGVRLVQGFDVSEHPSQIGGQVDDVPCVPGWDLQEFRNLARLEQYSARAVSRRLAEAMDCALVRCYNRGEVLA